MFSSDDIIYEYRDEQAVEDGILIPVSHLGILFDEKPLNRLTRSVFHILFEALPKEIDPHTREKAIDNTVLGEALEEALLTMVVYNGIIQGSVTGIKAWLIENELDGWTLMLPEDY